MKRTRSISHKIHGIERRLCLGFMIFSVALLGLYIYFVGKSIVNVVVREEVEFKIADINSKLSELELSYIMKKDSVNMIFAGERGFTSIAQKSFINRGTLVGRSLTLRNEI
ncbi:hypothetical protein HQ403_01000 [Candidatus Kaiserbacteria bacterium]|nr:hypothetical protein [Candidatus Kaiserbacteria bacterium]